MADTRRARDQIAVLSVAEGFFASSILFALLKLGLFERIGEGSRAVEDLAAEVGARPDTLARLLRAGVVVKLLESDDGTTFRLAPACRSVLLPSAGEAYVGHWILNLDFFREALARLDQAVMTSGPTVPVSDDLEAGAETGREFTLAMHDYASVRGRELARFLDTSGCRTVLDVGCGPGTYAFHLGAVNPDLELNLLDVAGVLEVAKEVEARFDLKNAVRYLPVDVVHEEIPGSYDLVLVSNTLHMLGEQESRKLLRRLYRCVNEGGSLVVQAQYMDDDRLGGRWPVFLDLVQLCITSGGRNHTVGETRAWLEEAGFVDVELNPMTLLNTNSFLRAYRR